MKRIFVHACAALVVTMLGAAPAAAQDWADEIARSIERQADQIAREVERHVAHIEVDLARHLDDVLNRNVRVVVNGQVVFAQRQSGEAARRAAQAAREAERRRRQDARRGQEYTDKVSRTLRLGRTGTFDLGNISGDIVVTGGAGNDVRIDAIKRVRHPSESEARALLQAIDIRIEERNGNVEVRTDYPRRNWSGGVDYTVSVPRDANVVLHSVSGDIRVSNLNGELRADTISGDLLATAVGRIRLAKSISGDVEIADSDGDEVTANVTSGSLIVRAVKARNVDLNSISGDLRLTDVESDRAFVKTISGDIEFAGRLSRNGRYEFQSHSGDVRVAPTGTQGFSLEASTFSGDLRSDYPLTLQGNNTNRFNRSGRGTRGVFGDGGSILSVQSFSGNITIVKR
jgi:DUF4097 and DUF4098 domain-containing protein YvlB